MRLFVDASALVAILAEEPDHVGLSERLDGASIRLWSAMSCWESINALRHALKIDLDAARRDVEAYAAFKRFEIVAVGEDERRGALDAYRAFGKGRHPAKLNMGDCFAYACAKANDARLLYKGNDFSKTDLA